MDNKSFLHKIIDFFKADDPEPKPENEVEPENETEVENEVEPENETEVENEAPAFEATSEMQAGIDEYTQYLRTVRKEQTRPIIQRMDVSGRFYSYQGSAFDFSDTPVWLLDNAAWYLLDDVNIDKVLSDMQELNLFAVQAELIADVPDFRVPLSDLIFTPEWVEQGLEMGWRASHIIPSSFTKTGRLPKYPLRVFLESRKRNYDARIKYLQNDKIGSAEIRVGELGKVWHSMTIRDNHIIRIIFHNGFENFPVYASI